MSRSLSDSMPAISLAPVSVENLVTPISQAVFYHELLFLLGSGCASGHAGHRPDARASAGRAGIAHDTPDRAADDGAADGAAGSLAAHLLGDFLARCQILLVLAHVYPGGIDHDFAAAPGTGGGGDEARENQGMSDNFHGQFP